MNARMNERMNEEAGRAGGMRKLGEQEE